MKKNKISKNWIKKQKKDIFVRKSKLEGDRSGAVFKSIEKDLENPLEWDKIDPVSYKPWKTFFDYNKTIQASKDRMESSDFISLIDDNAKWIKSIRDRDIYDLNYKKFKDDLLSNEEKEKNFKKISEYSSDLVFSSLPYEITLIAKDSTLGEKRKRWHKNLAKDIYVNEALNVLNDLRLSYIDR